VCVCDYHPLSWFPCVASQEPPPNVVRLPYLLVSAVALLPVLQVAVATALTPVHGPGVGHVEETLAASGAQVARQLPPVAAGEHPREGVTGMEIKK